MFLISRTKENSLNQEMIRENTTWQVVPATNIEEEW